MDLRPLFYPKSVAVIGASDEFSKLGFHVMKSLVQGGYEHPIYPVNPKKDLIMGLKAYPSVDKIPQQIDLAVVVVPNKAVLEVFKQCLSAGVKAFVLITAGFKEAEGEEGGILQEQLKELVGYKVPVVGPNTFGMVSYHSKLNASFTPEFSLSRPGNVAIVSQSGGISHLLGFAAQELGLSLSYVVGLGNRLNLDFHHMVGYLANEPNTKVAGLYIEGVEEPILLMKEIVKAGRTLPLVVMKAGVGEMADKASFSHTGSLAGNHQIFQRALKQAGALAVHDLESFLDLLKAYQILRPPIGPRVAILSGQAGPGIVGYDICVKKGLKVESFSKSTLEAIEAIIPPMAIRTNPVDLGPLWYDADATVNIVKTVLRDPEIDAVLFMMMFASANIRAIPGLLEGLRDISPEKPIFTCIRAPSGIWEDEIEEAEKLGLFCNFPTPERATKACYNMLLLESLRSKTKGGQIATDR